MKRGCSVLFAAAVLCGTITVAHAADEALVLLEQGQYRQAAAVCERRLAANPADGMAGAVLSRVRGQEGRLDDAVKLATAAVAAAPGSADVQYAYAEAYGRKAQDAGVLKAAGHAGKLKKAAEEALRLQPDHADALSMLVDFHRRAPGIMGGDRKKGAEYLDRLVRVDPAVGWTKKAGMAFSDKDTVQGAQCLERAVEQAPGSGRALVALASHLAQPGRDLARAERLARQVTETEPWRVGAWQVLAGLHAYQGRWTELDDVLERAEAANPERLAPCFTAARTLIVSEKDPARAERLLRYYLSRPPEIAAPSHANARWRLGQALEQQGRKEEAMAEWSLALQADPKLEAAKKDLKRLKG